MYGDIIGNWVYSNELRVPVQNFIWIWSAKGGWAVCCAPVFDNHDIGDHGDHDDNYESEENHYNFFAEFYLAPQLL